MTSLWLDKHRPNSLSKLTLHHEISARLESLARCEDIPHLMIYGPPGAGKKTRVMALLREIFGAGVEKMKLEHRSFKTSTNKVIEIATVGSNYHVECNPSDAGNNDRFVIQEVIKEIASHGNLQSSLGGPTARSFKILLISEADRLTRQAQAALRRTMEKYSAQCRIILLCNSASKIIDPLRSRCLSLRVPAPSQTDLAALLLSVCKKESVTLPPETALQIARLSDRNIRRALLMTETVVMQSTDRERDRAVHVQVQSDQALSAALPDWQIYTARLAREILSDQTPSSLLSARDKLYELLVNCIPATVILQTLLNELLKSLDDGLKGDVVHWASFYEHRLAQGSKEIFHLEAFVAKVMTLYKRFIVEIFG